MNSKSLKDFFLLKGNVDVNYSSVRNELAERDGGGAGVGGTC